MGVPVRVRSGPLLKRTKMSSYDCISRWAKEAKSLLKQGNLPAVKNTITWIQLQANEEKRREQRAAKRLEKQSKKSTK